MSTPHFAGVGAAKLTFALTTPYVYEALVVQMGVPPRVASALVVKTVLGAVLKPSSQPIPVDRIDWAQLGLRRSLSV